MPPAAARRSRVPAPNAATISSQRRFDLARAGPRAPPRRPARARADSGSRRIDVRRLVADRLSNTSPSECAGSVDSSSTRLDGIRPRERDARAPTPSSSFPRRPCRRRTAAGRRGALRAAGAAGVAVRRGRRDAPCFVFRRLPIGPPEPRDASADRRRSASRPEPSESPRRPRGSRVSGGQHLHAALPRDACVRTCDHPALLGATPIADRARGSAREHAVHDHGATRTPAASSAASASSVSASDNLLGQRHPVKRRAARHRAAAPRSARACSASSSIRRSAASGRPTRANCSRISRCSSCSESSTCATASDGLGRRQQPQRVAGRRRVDDDEVVWAGSGDALS